jgi:hypothetical protein
MPLVLIDRLLDGLNSDAVILDNELAARQAVDHLVSAGHIHIAALVGDQKDWTMRCREDPWPHHQSPRTSRRSDEGLRHPRRGGRLEGSAADSVAREVNERKAGSDDAHSSRSDLGRPAATDAGLVIGGQAGDLHSLGTVLGSRLGRPSGALGAVPESEWFKHNAYAEWYFNTIRIPGSPAAQHHHDVYDDAPYDDFLDQWTAAKFDPTAWAKLFAEAGASYVVPTTLQARRSARPQGSSAGATIMIVTRRGQKPKAGTPALPSPPVLPDARPLGARDG